MKILKGLIPAAILTAGLLWTSVTPSYANAAYAKKEVRQKKSWVDSGSGSLPSE